MKHEFVGFRNSKIIKNVKLAGEIVLTIEGVPVSGMTVSEVRLLFI